MTRLEEFVEAVKLGGKLKSQETKKCCCKKTVCWVFGIIGAVAVIAGIAYAVYRYLTPDYLDEFEDDFEDEDMEEDFFEDELDDIVEEEAAQEEPAAEPVEETAE